MSRATDVAKTFFAMATELRYKEAARANQRGFARLHRKIDQRDKRIAFLEEFIKLRQLTPELEHIESAVLQAKRENWERSNES